jgi:hypothetical protein
MRTSTGTSGRFWIVAAVGAVAFALLWRAVVAPARALADSERKRSGTLAEGVRGHFDPDGKPIELVEKTLAREKAILVNLRRDLWAIGVALPPEYEPGPGRDPLYFQEQLTEFRKWVRGSGVTFTNARAPLDFREEISEGMVPGQLARLAVARRFVEVVRNAGVKTVLRVQQLTVPSFRQEGPGADTEELPFKATVAADEESLVRLVHEMSRPAGFLSVRSTVVSVRDPSSGSFEATFELAGVRLLGSPEMEDAPEVEGGTKPEPEPEAEPGVLVPTAPSMEY